MLSECSCAQAEVYLAINQDNLMLYNQQQSNPQQIDINFCNQPHHQHNLLIRLASNNKLKSRFKQCVESQTAINQCKQKVRQIQEKLRHNTQLKPNNFTLFLQDILQNEKGQQDWLARKLLIVLLTIDLFMLMTSLITLILQIEYTAQNWRFIMDANRNMAWAFMVFYIAFYIIVLISASLQCDRPRLTKNCKKMSIEFITHMFAFFFNAISLLHTINLARIKLFPQKKIYIPLMQKPHCPLFFIYGLKNLLFVACFLTFIVQERFNYTARSGSTSDTLVFLFSFVQMAVWGLADLKYELNEKVANLLDEDMYEEEDQPMNENVNIQTVNANP